ncbi:hypothetical protein V6N13_042603 [Hibiscus sabdariffa]
MDQAGLTRADQLSTLPLLDRTVNGSGLAHWFNPSSPQLDWVTNGRDIKKMIDRLNKCDSSKTCAYSRYYGQKDITHKRVDHTHDNLNHDLL